LPGAIGQLINTTLRQLVVGLSANDVVKVWYVIRQLAFLAWALQLRLP
jgi:hypothetical protein